MLNIKKLDLLISTYIACIVTSELMGGKTFPIIGLGSLKLTASVAIFLLPLVFTINDVITEVYGKKRTKSIIRSGLCIIFFLLLFSVLATSLQPSTRFLSSEPAYDKIFGQSIRISAASLTAFTLAEFMDVLVFAKLRKKFGKKALWFRNNISNFISQFIDTSVFMFLAFYDLDRLFIVNISFLAGLIVPYWLVKCFMSVIETPFVYIGVKWLRNDRN